MQHTSRRSFIGALISMFSLPIVLGRVSKMFPKNLPQEFRKDGPTDYYFLRKQLNDFTSTFYGPHPCESCGVTIVKQALEHGGKEYEYLGDHKVLDFYKPHDCSAEAFKKLL